MVKSTVNLSVHRNTVEQRAKRQLGSVFRKEVLKVFKDSDIRMYVFVGIDAEGKAHASWDTGGIMPLWAVPGTIFKVLDSDMSTVEDDWKPPLRTVERNIREAK